MRSRLFAKFYADTDSSSDEEQEQSDKKKEDTVALTESKARHHEACNDSNANSEGHQEICDSEDDDWRKCLVGNGKTSDRKDLISRITTPAMTEECDNDDDDDDWRKCLINYKPSPQHELKVRNSSLISERDPVEHRRQHVPEAVSPASSFAPLSRKRPYSCKEKDKSDSDDEIPFTKFVKKGKRKVRSGINERSVTASDLLPLDNVDFSAESLEKLALEDMCNLTISVYLEEKSLKKSIVYLKTQLRTLSSRRLPSPTISDADDDDPWDEPPVADSKVDRENAVEDVIDEKVMPCDVISESIRDSHSTSDQSSRSDEGCSGVLHTSLQHVNPVAEVAKNVPDVEVESTALSAVSAPRVVQLPHQSATTYQTAHQTAPAAAQPSFDLYLPPTSKTFFKRDQIEANHRSLPPLRPPPPPRVPSPVMNDSMLQESLESESVTNDEVEKVEEGVGRDSLKEGEEDGKSVVEQYQYHPVTTAASTVFGIDLCILTIITFLDFETRKRVAVVNSDCYSVCSHNISFATENTRHIPELAHRSLYEENVLVDCNERYIAKNKISAVVKVGMTTENVKFQPSAWAACTEQFQQEVLEKFPNVFTTQRKTRADSIPAFGVVPHKAIKGGDALDDCRHVNHIVDVSAQIVVLDRRAKRMKQNFENCKKRLRSLIAVGESYSCLLGKITIRQPIKGKTTTQYCFNKVFWDAMCRREEISRDSTREKEKEKYLFKTGILTRGVTQGRIVLGRAATGPGWRVGVGGSNASSSGTKGMKTASRVAGAMLVSTINKSGGISYDM